LNSRIISSLEKNDVQCVVVDDGGKKVMTLKIITKKEEKKNPLKKSHIPDRNLCSIYIKVIALIYYNEIMEQFFFVEQ
jgi:hypothetical protein